MRLLQEPTAGAASRADGLGGQDSQGPEGHPSAQGHPAGLTEPVLQVRLHPEQPSQAQRVPATVGGQLMTPASTRLCREGPRSLRIMQQEMTDF